MRSNRLWIGVVCGVALALGVVAAVDAGTQANGEPAEGQQATDFTEQLEKNQSIASEAMKRSNRSLNYLAAIRTTQSDDADDGDGGVHAGSGGGWTGDQLARGQKQLWATLRPDANKVDQTIAQSGPASGPNRITSTRTDIGVYVVDFKSEVSGCSWSATPFFPASGGEFPLIAVTARVKADPGLVDPKTGAPRLVDPNKVRVVVFPVTAAPKPIDNNVYVQVLC